MRYHSWAFEALRHFSETCTGVDATEFIERDDKGREYVDTNHSAFRLALLERAAEDDEQEED